MSLVSISTTVKMSKNVQTLSVGVTRNMIESTTRVIVTTTTGGSSSMRTGHTTTTGHLVVTNEETGTTTGLKVAIEQVNDSVSESKIPTTQEKY